MDKSSFLFSPLWLSPDYLGFLLHSSTSVLLLLHLKSVTAVKSQQEISQQFQKQREKMLNYQVTFSQFRIKQHSQKDAATLVHFILCAERIFVSQSSNVTIVSFHRKENKAKPNHRQIYITDLAIYLYVSDLAIYLNGQVKKCHL